MNPTVPETVEILDDGLQMYHRLSRLHLSAMQHLLAEQYEVTAPVAQQVGVSVSGGGTPDNIAAMLARIAALESYAYRGHLLATATAEVARVMRAWERALQDAISDRTPPHDDRPRCAGTNADADGRLGGCGNLTERYHEGGKVKYRPLCKTCRTQGKHT